jgi:hypothetical protein
MLSIDNVLEEIQQHPMEEQELIEELLHKRLIEQKRELIFSDYLKSKDDLKNDDVKSGSVDDLFKTIQ